MRSQLGSDVDRFHAMDAPHASTGGICAQDSPHSSTQSRPGSPPLSPPVRLASQYSNIARQPSEIHREPSPRSPKRRLLSCLDMVVLPVIFPGPRAIAASTVVEVLIVFPVARYLDGRLMKQSPQMHRVNPRRLLLRTATAPGGSAGRIRRGHPAAG